MPRQNGKSMSKKIAAVDYERCHPEDCANGVCLAVLECEHGSLMQEALYEVPEINPAKWCNGCAKCAQACPNKAIKML